MIRHETYIRGVTIFRRRVATTFNDAINNAASPGTCVGTKGLNHIKLVVSQNRWQFRCTVVETARSAAPEQNRENNGFRRGVIDSDFAELRLRAPCRAATRATMEARRRVFFKHAGFCSQSQQSNSRPRFRRGTRGGLFIATIRLKVRRAEQILRLFRNASASASRFEANC